MQLVHVDDLLHLVEAAEEDARPVVDVLRHHVQHALHVRVDRLPARYSPLAPSVLCTTSPTHRSQTPSPSARTRTGCAACRAGSCCPPGTRRCRRTAACGTRRPPCCRCTAPSTACPRS